MQETQLSLHHRRENRWVYIIMVTIYVETRLVAADKHTDILIELWTIVKLSETLELEQFSSTRAAVCVYLGAACGAGDRIKGLVKGRACILHVA